jgi:hypothetical protein
MISENQRAVIHGLKIQRHALVEQIQYLDLLILNATSVLADISALEHSTTAQTHRELSAAELAARGVPVLGTQPARRRG